MAKIQTRGEPTNQEKTMKSHDEQNPPSQQTWERMVSCHAFLGFSARMVGALQKPMIMNEIHVRSRKTTTGEPNQDETMKSHDRQNPPSQQTWERMMSCWEPTNQEKTMKYLNDSNTHEILSHRSEADSTVVADLGAYDVVSCVLRPLGADGWFKGG
ncbi:hypothetical protein BU17DRAFT_67078 [Hysterangium stoloniferum]|nr:hypothetical protein BU17DRAFT_67078 [Hysterangium stoloniferum]